MAALGLETHIVDSEAFAHTVARFRDARILLPALSQLADPTTIPEAVTATLEEIDSDEPHPLNLFRVHWYNDADRRGRTEVPGHIVLTEALTGVAAPIVVVLGDRFPMIAAHKVLAAYGCLAPRIITGQFDPTRHRAVWPSTGNYCRGGVAISRIMGCRGVAVLPEEMSAERFTWLDKWVADPADIIRTPGSESNVKEIYDECARLDAKPENIIFNQFAEFGNHLVHYSCTGRALAAVFRSLQREQPRLRLRAFTSATGSAGTIAAGDFLKETYGSATVAVEALECPTLLYNGFGAHNIQGIGDKHVPLIHNVMATDFVAGISDVATDDLGVLFNSDAGRAYLTGRRGLSPESVEGLRHLGLSGICNVLAAIKTARYLDLGADDVIMTVGTDSAAMYGSERDKTLAARFPSGFDAINAGETFARHVLGVGTDHLMELSRVDRRRVFNLGYFTWVEQQGVALDEFEARRRQGFWTALRDLIPAWDAMIAEFNGETGVTA